MPQGVPRISVQPSLVVTHLREDVLIPLADAAVDGRHLVRLAVGRRHIGMPDSVAERFYQHPRYVDVVNPKSPPGSDVVRSGIPGDVIVGDVIVWRKISGGCDVTTERRIWTSVWMVVVGGCSGQEEVDHVAGDDVAEPAAVGRVIATAGELIRRHGPFAASSNRCPLPDETHEQATPVAGRLEVAEMFERRKHVDERIVVSFEEVGGMAAIRHYPVQCR